MIYKNLKNIVKSILSDVKNNTLIIQREDHTYYIATSYRAFALPESLYYEFNRVSGIFLLLDSDKSIKYDDSTNHVQDTNTDVKRMIEPGEKKVFYTGFSRNFMKDKKHCTVDIFKNDKNEIITINRDFLKPLNGLVPEEISTNGTKHPVYFKFDMFDCILLPIYNNYTLTAIVDTFTEIKQG